MPLLDHFHPPLHPQHHWESFHSNWATRLADLLNDRLLPPEYIAEEHTHAGTRLEIDVATFEHDTVAGRSDSSSGATAVLPRAVYTPPAPGFTIPAVLSDSFEVRVFATAEGMTLVAVIELVSPGNKDLPEECRAFATKCASYLYQGISLIVVDIVTNRQANLHNEIMRVMNADSACELPAAANLYAVAYRPALRDEQSEVDVWPVVCALSEPLPTLPLRLKGDLFVPVDFESTYDEACRRRRLV
jgi:hypothetical protein